MRTDSVEISKKTRENEEYSTPRERFRCLRGRALTKHFPVAPKRLLQRERQVLKAVEAVDFDLPRGTTLGLVGESGAGGRARCSRWSA